MQRLLFRHAGPLALVGLIVLGMTPGKVSADSRLGGEDMLFSYSRETDRLVFGEPGQLSDAQSGLNRPDRSILYMQDLKTGARTKVFEVLNGDLGISAISPSGSIIAVQIYVHQGDFSANPRLLVLTAEGKEIAAFPQSRDFSWSPDSRFLAYTTGDWEGGYTFRSSGTWVYDQTFKTTTKIFDTGDFVAWSPSDNSLYIADDSSGDREIRRYDPRTQAVIQTNRLGIFFSPSGRYYHTGIPRDGGAGVEVHDAQTNQPVLSHRPRLTSVLPHARIVGWASEGEMLILEVFSQGPKTKEYPQGRVDSVLYDVAHDIARVITDDSVIGWQHGQAILHARGKFTKRPLSSFPLLPERPEKPVQSEKPPGKPFSPPKP
ncbi:MAG: hypothetical protein HP491_12965 [Nitrospira sp.]|nr:hypothetical protein [Nitrospira sp.]MBH0182436.1 hypothetical protein [Nitrospira sp.]MBH0184467.1 hypothetical protein [Nitrospira sp.]